MVKDQNPHNYPTTSHFIGDKWVCNSCVESMDICFHCDNARAIYKVVKGKKVCQDCYHEKYHTCGVCKGEHLLEAVVTDEMTKATYRGLFKKYGDSVCSACFRLQKTRFKKYKVRKCSRCEKIHSDSKHKNYCDSCYGGLPACKECGKKSHTLKSATLEGGGYTILCTSCLAKYRTCKNCRSISKNAKTITNTTGTYHLCKSCKDLSFCKSCRSFGKRSHKDEEICVECMDTYYNNTCSSCGSVKDPDKRCRTCGSAKDEIYNYTLKPRIVFHTLKKEVTPLMFGIENEVTFEDCSDMRKSLKRMYKANDPTLLLAKSDSSIGGCGFEIVTQPMSLKFFNKFDLTTLFHKDMKLDESCGMHVHVSRRGFGSDVHILKVVSFVHDNESLVNKIAGRGYTGYNDKISEKPSSNVLRCKGHGGNRSSRINLSNSTTIEFRMFAGCTKESEMRMRVEFLHALITWTRQTSIKGSKSVDSLQKFIKSDTRSYSNISKFMETV